QDDISGIGQTKAALKLTTGLADSRKEYLLAPGVGHYGIFNGSRWRTRIAPQLEQFIATHRAREEKAARRVKGTAA
ncbi:MAG TPA: polyhydroxyalkanoate depolymerase, partial [Novosphingobium sp.]